MVADFEGFVIYRNDQPSCLIWGGDCIDHLNKENKTFINTYVPIVRHRIARKTENHKETSRNQFERPLFPFVV